MGTQQFCFRWSNHHSNMLTVFEQLLLSEAFIDVTLACEGQRLKAHKMVLSACSPIFQSMFLECPCKHAIVLLRDMRYTDLKVIIDYMYSGEISVTLDRLPVLLKTAEALKVKGLSELISERGQCNTTDGIQQEIVPTTQPSSLVQKRHRSKRKRSRSPLDSNRRFIEDQMKINDEPDSRENIDVGLISESVEGHHCREPSLNSEFVSQCPAASAKSFLSIHSEDRCPPNEYISGDESIFQSMTVGNVPFYPNGHIADVMLSSGMPLVSSPSSAELISASEHGTTTAVIKQEIIQAPSIVAQQQHQADSPRQKQRKRSRRLPSNTNSCDSEYQVPLVIKEEPEPCSLENIDLFLECLEEHNSSDDPSANSGCLSQNSTVLNLSGPCPKSTPPEDDHTYAKKLAFGDRSTSNLVEQSMTIENGIFPDEGATSPAPPTSVPQSSAELSIESKQGDSMATSVVPVPVQEVMECAVTSSIIPQQQHQAESLPLSRRKRGRPRKRHRGRPGGHPFDNQNHGDIKPKKSLKIHKLTSQGNFDFTPKSMPTKGHLRPSHSDEPLTNSGVTSERSASPDLSVANFKTGLIIQSVGKPTTKEFTPDDLWNLDATLSQLMKRSVTVEIVRLFPDGQGQVPTLPAASSSSAQLTTRGENMQGTTGAIQPEMKLATCTVPPFVAQHPRSRSPLPSRQKPIEDQQPSKNKEPGSQEIIDLSSEEEHSCSLVHVSSTNPSATSAAGPSLPVHAATSSSMKVTTACSENIPCDTHTTDGILEEILTSAISERGTPQEIIQSTSSSGIHPQHREESAPLCYHRDRVISPRGQNCFTDVPSRNSLELSSGGKLDVQYPLTFKKSFLRFLDVQASGSVLPSASMQPSSSTEIISERGTQQEIIQSTVPSSGVHQQHREESPPLSRQKRRYQKRLAPRMCRRKRLTPRMCTSTYMYRRSTVVRSSKMGSWETIDLTSEGHVLSDEPCTNFGFTTQHSTMLTSEGQHGLSVEPSRNSGVPSQNSTMPSLFVASAKSIHSKDKHATTKELPSLDDELDLHVPMSKLKQSNTIENASFYPRGQTIDVTTCSENRLGNGPTINVLQQKIKQTTVSTAITQQRQHRAESACLGRRKRRRKRTQLSPSTHDREHGQLPSKIKELVLRELKCLTSEKHSLAAEPSTKSRVMSRHSTVPNRSVARSKSLLSMQSKLERTTTALSSGLEARGQTSHSASVQSGKPCTLASPENESEVILPDLDVPVYESTARHTSPGSNPGIKPVSLVRPDEGPLVFPVSLHHNGRSADTSGATPIQGSSNPQADTSQQLSPGIHLGQFICELCDHEYIEESCLQRHRESHRGGQPYKCGACDTLFRLSSSSDTVSRSNTGITELILMEM